MRARILRGRKMHLTRKTLFGNFTAFEESGKLTALEFGGNTYDGENCPLFDELFDQLALYFSGKLFAFDIPLAPSGTAFQQLVWAELLKIPYGKTVSYKDIAVGIGNPAASRAVGMANHRNPIPILIPCHRVIGTNGKLVGYGGGIEIKMKLLKLENGGCYGRKILT